MIRLAMSRSIVSMLIFVCVGGAAAARPAPDHESLAAANGTCRSRVEPFGYRCEEHTVVAWYYR